jgi:hypothetical protein
LTIKAADGKAGWFVILSFARVIMIDLTTFARGIIDNLTPA